MRKFLLFCSATLLVISGISQNLNVAFHDGLDEAGNIVSINTKSYYWERVRVACCMDRFSVRCVDHKDSTLWATCLNRYEHNIPQTLIATSDKCLVVIFLASGCDTGVRDYYLTKLDTSGSIVFEVKHTAKFVDVVGHSDSTIYAISSDSLYHYSKSGQLISQSSIGITNMNSIANLNNGNLLINGKLNTTLNNVQYSTAGYSVVASAVSTSTISKFVQAAAGMLIGKTNQGILQYYTSNLSLVWSSPLVVNDFIIRNDSIFVVGTENWPGQAYYRILDLNLNQIFYAPSILKGLSPKSLTFNSLNRINVITIGQSGTSPMWFRSLYQFPVNGAFSSKSDVGVTSFTTSNAKFFYNYSNMYDGVMEMDVRVKNYGTDTVRSFYLNYYAQYFLCYILLHKQYTIDVPPGDSVTVQTGTFYMQPFYLSGPAPPTKYFKVCLFTTIPNASNDIEINNDSKCDSVLFTFTTGIGENYPDEINVNLFPNPSGSSFTVNSTYMIEKIKIVDLNGKIVKVEEINAYESNLNSTNLSPGVYFVHFLTEKGGIVKKLVKD